MLGLSQKTMAERCGIPWRTYQDRERGVCDIKGDFAKLVEMLLEKHRTN